MPNSRLVHPRGALVSGPRAPVASFTFSVSQLTATFTSAATDKFGGIIDRWLWTFGDGNSSDEVNPVHTYAAPGTYTVMLTVTDDDGMSGSFSAQVTVAAPAPVVTMLRIGLFNFQDLGSGPGGDTGAPIYRVAFFNPTTTSVESKIALADQHDVILVLNFAGSRSGWTVNGNFDWSLYEAKVRRFQNISAVRDAIARKRVFPYVVDEANHSSFNNTINPSDVNDMGLLHKLIWPGVHTFVRMSGDTLAVGWNGKAGPPTPYLSRVTNRTETGWSGVDYGWAQRSGQHNNETLSAFYARHKAALAGAGLGMVPGLNWWNGGIWNNLDGVTACWDAQANGSSSGYLIGQSEPNPFTFAACGPLPSGVDKVVANPAWIQKWAQIVAADADAPFAFLWTHTGPLTSVQDAAAVALEARADYVSAMDAAINTGLARSSFNGLRPAKTL